MPMNSAKNSRSICATFAAAAAAPSAACLTPSGEESPRDLASRARRLASGARLSSADSSAYSRARAASISSTAPATEIVPESAPTPRAARTARSRRGSRMAILEWLRLNGLSAEKFRSTRGVNAKGNAVTITILGGRWSYLKSDELTATHSSAVVFLGALLLFALAQIIVGSSYIRSWRRAVRVEIILSDGG